MMTGILVVTWNSADVIERCLSACEQIENVRILVVDNASSDETTALVRQHRSVRLIPSEINHGFAGGVNLGMRALADCDAVLLLNPDAAPVRGVERLAEAVLQTGVGAAAGTLTDYAGRRQDGFNIRRFPTPWTLSFEVLGLNRVFPWNPVNQRYRVVPSHSGVQEVEQPAAAFLMVNRRAWEAVGGMDEGFYPAWFEDVDFCWKLRQNGHRILYFPDAEARHIGGHSAASLDWESRQLFWYGSLLRYACLRFSPGGRAAVAWAVMAGSIPRALAGASVRGSRRSVGVFGEVFRRAWSCWRKGTRTAPAPTNRHQREGETAHFTPK